METGWIAFWVLWGLLGACVWWRGMDRSGWRVSVLATIISFVILVIIWPVPLMSSGWNEINGNEKQ